MQFEGSLGFMRPCLKNNKQTKSKITREDKTRQPTCDTRGHCCGDDSCPGAELTVGWEVYSRILPLCSGGWARLAGTLVALQGTGSGFENEGGFSQTDP